MNNVIFLNQEHDNGIELDEDYNLIHITHEIYKNNKSIKQPKVSICVLAYRNLEDTIRCVNSVLKYTKNIEYELVLLDNGSDDDDETINFFKSVNYNNKKIIKYSYNLGGSYNSINGTQILYKYSSGEYFLFLANDIIITENAIQNMIKALDSDCSIGLVTPMSSNAWMRQNPNLYYSTIDEMQLEAKKFNAYDPKKWEERMTIATVSTMFRREAVDKTGFFDFMCEHSLCKRLRLYGYKLILLGDTFVCHNHDYNKKKNTHSFSGNGEKTEKLAKITTEIRDKELGNDLFDEMISFKSDLVRLYDDYKDNGTVPRILGIDVECGQGMLDIKNKLRQQGIFDTKSVAFTTNAKYYKWLETVSDMVVWDREEFLGEKIKGNKFDYILIGKPINLFKEPIKVLACALEHLDDNSELGFYVNNRFGVSKIYECIYGYKLKSKNYKDISIEEILNCIKYIGFDNVVVEKADICYSSYIENIVNKILDITIKDNINKEKIFTYNYCIKIKK